MFVERPLRLFEVTNSSRNFPPEATPVGLSAQSVGTVTSAEHAVGGAGSGSVASTLCPRCAASAGWRSIAANSSAAARIEPPSSWIDPQPRPRAQSATPSASKSPACTT